MKTFEQRFPIRIHDVDAAGIVFFAQYYVLMHDVYESFMDSIGCSIAAAIDEGEIIIPVVESSARYLRPMRHGEIITGRLVVAELSRLTYVVRVEFHGPDGVHRSTLNCRHVCVDAKTMKPRPLPEGLSGALAEYRIDGVKT